MAEFKAMSLRQCAEFDAANHGPNAVAELRRKWILRKQNYRRVKRTNIGDPMHNKKLGRNN